MRGAALVGGGLGGRRGPLDVDVGARGGKSSALVERRGEGGKREVSKGECGMCVACDGRERSPLATKGRTDEWIHKMPHV